jgi:hypothetical protein
MLLLLPKQYANTNNGYIFFKNYLKKQTERETGYSEMAFTDTGKGMRV